jgi:hypothetical protein
MLASVIRRVRRGAYWGTRQALDARELALNFLPFGASEKWPRFGVNSPQRALFPAHRTRVP